MDPEDLIERSQKSAAWPSPVQHQSKSPSHFLNIRFKIILQSMLGLPITLFSSGFSPKPCSTSSVPPYVPHALPSSFFSFWLTTQIIFVEENRIYSDELEK